MVFLSLSSSGLVVFASVGGTFAGLFAVALDDSISIGVGVVGVGVGVGVVVVGVGVGVEGIVGAVAVVIPSFFSAQKVRKSKNKA